MQGTAAEPGTSIAVRNLSETWLRDGLVIEVVYLTPATSCNADDTVYRELLAVRGLTDSDHVFRPAGAASTPFQRIADGSILRIRLNVAAAALASSLIPVTVTPCGPSFAYRLAAVHVIGSRNMLERGIDNTRDFLDTPIESTAGAAASALEQVAQQAAHVAGILLKELWWIPVLGIAYFAAVKGRR